MIADTGFGPHGKMLGSETSAELMDDFSRKGLKTDEIDTVFMSHLHADHVGWNIDPNTSTVPTFANARYTVHRADWEHFTVPDDDSEFGMEPIERSVIPLQEIGVLDLMDGETELAPGVTAIPTPGHTPGHMALLLSSGKERALFVGDILINPMHATDTDLPFALDTDQVEAMKVRHQVLDRAENEGITVIGSHLSPPGWGTMVSVGKVEGTGGEWGRLVVLSLDPNSRLVSWNLEEPKMKKYDVSEIEARCDEIIEEVVETGERVLVTKDGKPHVEMQPIAQSSTMSSSLMED